MELPAPDKERAFLFLMTAPILIESEIIYKQAYEQFLVKMSVNEAHNKKPPENSRGCIVCVILFSFPYGPNA